MSRIQLSGGAYQARSVISSAQRCLNLYAETLPTANQYTGGTGMGEPSQFAYYPTPGLRLTGTQPENGVRTIKQATTGQVYAVAGSGVYRVNPTDWSSTQLGSITAGKKTPVSMQDNTQQMVVVDGSPNGWTIDLTNDAFAPISNATSDPDGMWAGADRVDYLDTYLLFNKPGTPQFYWSGSLATTLDSLDFANKSSFTDLLVTIAVAKREIWLVGELTTEIWYNSGYTFDTSLSGSQTNIQSTFQQVQGTFVDHGCAARYSVAVYDNSIFWLSRDRLGQGFVLKAAGYQYTRISSFAIEQEIAGYATISDAIGFCYLLGGHAFYVLTFPKADHTWVFDITTGLWHEWLWIDTNGVEHRHRANCCYPIDGTIVVGDWQNGNLYALDRDVFTDNGQPIKRVRAYPHIINDADRVFYRQFVADIETGNPGTLPSAGAQTLLTCSFTAPDGTLLQDYSNAADTNATWTLVSGSAQINDDEMVSPIGSGSGLYQSPTLTTADYSLSFRAVPTGYTNVATATIYALARSTGVGTGYRAQVSGDGSQYWLTLGVEGGASTTIAMGTLASGFYTVTM